MMSEVDGLEFVNHIKQIHSDNIIIGLADEKTPKISLGMLKAGTNNIDHRQEANRVPGELGAIEIAAPRPRFGHQYRQASTEPMIYDSGLPQLLPGVDSYGRGRLIPASQIFQGGPCEPRLELLP